MRSASVSHDTWKNSEKPRPNSSTSSSVAPVKPSAFWALPPIRAPSTPPGARGSATFRLYMRTCSSPTLPASIITKPIARMIFSCR
jgi:hypothetical protein